MEEKKFPIYKYWATWKQDDLDYNNGFSSSIMFKEYKTEDELNKLLQEIIQKNAYEKYTDKNPVLIDSGIEFKEEESWCLRWFNHYTYNLFKTDEEVKKSFNEFIERKIKQNWENGHYQTERKEGNSNPFYCFMGAEDRWRWNICRCEHCQEVGKITIDH